MRSRSNGGVIGAYALPTQNGANGVFFIHDAAIFNTGANPIWPLASGYITSATGGTITTAVDNANYKLHTFTSNGTFTITNGSGFVEILLVGGGGSGGFAYGSNITGAVRGGGGAGGQVTIVQTFLNSGTTLTIEVGRGGGTCTNTNYDLASTGGKPSKVTASGKTIISYGGGPGAIASGTSVVEYGNSTYGGGGNGWTTSLATAVRPLRWRTAAKSPAAVRVWCRRARRRRAR